MGLHHINSRGFALALIVGALYLFFYHGSVILAPNDHQFNIEGDAMKAYYSLAYHVAHDNDWWHFDGMHYPFGDHLYYPDAQPILANSLKVLSTVFPSISDHTVAWVNIYLLLGILMGLPFLFLLFREFKVRWGLAIAVAFAAWVLSPQVMRMHGHFGLAQIWVIPAVLWAYLRSMHGSHPNKYGLLVMLFLFIAVWTHPYLAVIGIATIWLHALLNLVTKKRFQLTINKALVYSLVPMIAFLLINSVGPEHAGRNEYPMGFFEHLTTFDNLVSALREERSPVYSSLFPLSDHMTIEGLCYMGAAIIALPISLISLSRSRFSDFGNLNRDHGGILLMGLCGLVLLVYAMGIPFIWDLKRFVWKIPLLDEFRSAGRFSWPFYYITFAFIAVVFERFSRSAVNRPLLYGALVLFIAIQLYEAHYYRSSLLRNVVKTNLFDRSRLPIGFEKTITHLNQHGTISAFLPLPYFHYGSDGVLVGDSRAQADAMVVSFHTGLPMLASAIAKTSINEARTQASIYNPPFYEQPLKELFDRNEEIAILAFGGFSPEPDEALLNAAGNIEHVDGNRLVYHNAYDLLGRHDLQNPEQLFEVHRQNHPRGSKYHFKGDTMLFFDFDSLETPLALRGRGSYVTNYGEYETVAQLHPHPFQVGKEYVISFWCDHSRPTADFTMYIVSQESEPAAGEHWDFVTDARRARVRNNGRSFVELPFTCTMEGIFRFYVSHPNYLPSKALIDDVLIREKNDTVTFMENGQLFWNGLVVPVSP